MAGRRTVKSNKDHHPERWYLERLLDAFEALGATSTRVAIFKWLEVRLASHLTVDDREWINGDRCERWKKSVDWNKRRLILSGDLHPPVKGGIRGVWKLTEQGQRLLQRRKADNPQ